MRSRLTLMAAFAVFIAFAGLTADDLRRSDSAFTGEAVSAPVTNPEVVAVPATQLEAVAAPMAAPAAVAASASNPEAAAAPAATPEAAPPIASPDLAPPEVSLDVVPPPVIAPAAGPSSTAASVEGALAVLGRHVQRTSHPHALRYALQAYYSYKARHPGEVRKPYFYYVDFGLDNRTPRGYVFDMERMSVVEGPFAVAHGRGSAVGNAGVPTRFLNRNGSNATSLGLYLAQETYSFRGRSGGRSYRSIGLRLKGLSGGFNSAARARGIVVHGAPYVTASRAGRSEGCPAMELDLAQELIPKIAEGGLVFHFSPLDDRWMREDPWASGAARLAFGG